MANNLLNDPNFQAKAAEYEQAHGLTPGLLLSVAKAESNGNPNAVSPKGAQGMFQFMPATAKEYGVDVTDPYSSMAGAAKFLGDRKKAYNGNEAAAVAYYNGGHANANAVVKTGSPVAKETKGYVQKVLSALNPIGTAHAAEVDDGRNDPEYQAYLKSVQQPVKTVAKPVVDDGSNDPEYQAYLKSMNQPVAKPVVEEKPKSTATPFIPAVSQEEINKQGLVGRLGSSLQNMGANYEGLVRGTAQGLRGLIDGPAYLLAKASDKIGLTDGEGTRVGQMNDQNEADYQAATKDQYIPGAVGRTIGTVAPFMMTGGASATPQVAATVEKAPLLARALTQFKDYGKLAAQGAAFGAASTSSDEQSMVDNAILGGIAGPAIGGAVKYVAQPLGKAVKAGYQGLADKMAEFGMKPSAANVISTLGRDAPLPVRFGSKVIEDRALLGGGKAIDDAQQTVVRRINEPIGVKDNKGAILKTIRPEHYNEEGVQRLPGAYENYDAAVKDIKVPFDPARGTAIDNLTTEYSNLAANPDRKVLSALDRAKTNYEPDVIPNPVSKQPMLAELQAKRNQLNGLTAEDIKAEQDLMNAKANLTGVDGKIKMNELRGETPYVGNPYGLKPVDAYTSAGGVFGQGTDGLNYGINPHFERQQKLINRADEIYADLAKQHTDGAKSKAAPITKLFPEPELTVFDQGTKYEKKQWMLGDKIHREDGPALEFANGSKEWFLNGKRHRTDGPAMETPEGDKSWIVNGKMHREDGPALIRANGDKEWYKNDVLHREDGPAIEYADGAKEWYKNGQLHRIDGPAIEHGPKTDMIWNEDAILPHWVEKTPNSPVGKDQFYTNGVKDDPFMMFMKSKTLEAPLVEAPPVSQGGSKAADILAMIRAKKGQSPLPEKLDPTVEASLRKQAIEQAQKEANPVIAETINTQPTVIPDEIKISPKGYNPKNNTIQKGDSLDVMRAKLHQAKESGIDVNKSTAEEIKAAQKTDRLRATLKAKNEAERVAFEAQYAKDNPTVSETLAGLRAKREQLAAEIDQLTNRQKSADPAMVDELNQHISDLNQKISNHKDTLSQPRTMPAADAGRLVKDIALERNNTKGEAGQALEGIRKEYTNTLNNGIGDKNVKLLETADDLYQRQQLAAALAKKSVNSKNGIPTMNNLNAVRDISPEDIKRLADVLKPTGMLEPKSSSLYDKVNSIVKIASLLHLYTAAITGGATAANMALKSNSPRIAKALTGNTGWQKGINKDTSSKAAIMAALLANRIRNDK